MRKTREEVARRQVSLMATMLATVIFTSGGPTNAWALPPAARLPVVHIRSAAATTPGVPWRNLQTPATNGRWMGVGGCGLALWKLTRPTAAPMPIGPFTWVPAPTPGRRHLWLTDASENNSTGLLVGSDEPAGSYTLEIGRDDAPPTLHEISRGTVPQIVAVDADNPSRYALWNGVAFLVQDLAARTIGTVSAAAARGGAVRALALDYPALAIVTGNPGGDEAITVVDLVTGTKLRTVTGLTDATVALSGNALIWSQAYQSLPLGVPTHQLFYCDLHSRSAPQFLFTPQAGFDFGHPSIGGDRLAFLLRWPASGRSARKVAVLVYDLAQLRTGTSDVQEISDRALWVDSLCTIGAYGRRPGPTFVAYFQNPGPTASVKIPELACGRVP